jgi:hypothetical protein
MHLIFRMLSLLPIIALTSCDPSETRTMNQKENTSVAIDPATGPIEAKFKQNPSPKQAYRVILDFAEAPGSFAVIEGFAQYAAPGCTYIINEAAGATAHPEKVIPVTYTKVDERRYTAIVHTDGMQDEDYFGQGVCEWNLVVVSAQLRATGAQGETRFFATLSRDALLAHQSQSRRHEKKRYPSDPSVPDFSSLGLDPPSEDSFSLTLTSEAVTP